MLTKKLPSQVRGQPWVKQADKVAAQGRTWQGIAAEHFKDDLERLPEDKRARMSQTLGMLLAHLHGCHPNSLAFDVVAIPELPVLLGEVDEVLARWPTAVPQRNPEALAPNAKTATFSDVPRSGHWYAMGYFEELESVVDGAYPHIGRDPKLVQMVVLLLNNRHELSDLSNSSLYLPSPSLIIASLDRMEKLGLLTAEGLKAEPLHGEIVAASRSSRQDISISNADARQRLDELRPWLKECTHGFSRELQRTHRSRAFPSPHRVAIQAYAQQLRREMRLTEVETERLTKDTAPGVFLAKQLPWAFDARRAQFEQTQKLAAFRKRLEQMAWELQRTVKIHEKAQLERTDANTADADAVELNPLGILRRPRGPRQV